MTDPTAAFFGALGRRGHEPLLGKAQGTLRVDVVEGKRSDRWLVTIDRGDVAVSRDDIDADCVLRGDKTLLDGLVRGEVNAMAAVLRGALAVDGDPELLVLFQRLLPGPPASRPRRRGAGTKGER
jgi:ubiquinone biosynthesis protein UbiJ